MEGLKVTLRESVWRMIEDVRKSSAQLGADQEHQRAWYLGQLSALRGVLTLIDDEDAKLERELLARFGGAS